MPVSLHYYRVSKEDQGREGLSLPAQQADCREYARRMGCVIGTEYTDVMKGTRDDRPHYQAMLAEMRQLRASGVPVAVVTKRLDRLGRKLLEQLQRREELKTLGVGLHSVADGGELTDLTANILSSVAQEEARRIGERVRDVLTHVIVAGWHPGGRAPWGYKWRDATPEERLQGAPKRVLEIDPVTAPYVRELFERAAAGEAAHQLSIWAKALPDEARGMRGEVKLQKDGTPVYDDVERARRISRRAVRLILSAPVYIARQERGDEDVLARPVGRWPALIDDATWQQVQDHFAAHKKMPRQATGTYLLTGLLRCPQCGGRMSGMEPARPGRSLGRYRCTSFLLGARRGPQQTTCLYTAGLAAVDSDVLRQVGELLEVAELLSDPDVAEGFRAEWRQRRAPASNDVAACIREKEAEAEAARRRIRRATDKFVDDQIDKAEYDDKCARERVIEEAAMREIQRLRAQVAAPKLPDPEHILRSFGGWASVLRSGDMPAQREMLAELIERIEPVRIGWGKYAAKIDWTETGEALREVAETIQSES